MPDKARNTVNHSNTNKAIDSTPVETSTESESYATRFVNPTFGKTLEGYQTIEFVFRGDLRKPDIVNKTGFKARGNSENIRDHVCPKGGNNSSPKSAFIATSTSIEVATTFPYLTPSTRIKQTWVYVINPQKNAVHIPNAIDQLVLQKQMYAEDGSINKMETERAARYRIASADIKGAFPVKISKIERHGEITLVRERGTTLIPNPNYKPPFEVRLLNAAKIVGGGFTFIGAGYDIFILYKSHEYGKRSGDYDPFYLEVIRVPLAWGLAPPGGAVGMEVGAACGTCIAPGIGTAIGAVVGGFAGSVAGYFVGSKLATVIYDSATNPAQTLSLSSTVPFSLSERFQIMAQLEKTPTPRSILSPSNTLLNGYKSDPFYVSPAFQSMFPLTTSNTLPYVFLNQPVKPRVTLKAPLKSNSSKVTTVQKIDTPVLVSEMIPTYLDSLLSMHWEKLTEQDRNQLALQTSNIKEKTAAVNDVPVDTQTAKANRQELAAAAATVGQTLLSISNTMAQAGHADTGNYLAIAGHVAIASGAVVSIYVAEGTAAVFTAAVPLAGAAIGTAAVIWSMSQRGGSSGDLRPILNMLAAMQLENRESFANLRVQIDNRTATMLVAFQEGLGALANLISLLQYSAEDTTSRLQSIEQKLNREFKRPDYKHLSELVHRVQSYLTGKASKENLTGEGLDNLLSTLENFAVEKAMTAEHTGVDDFISEASARSIMEFLNTIVQTAETAAQNAGYLDAYLRKTNLIAPELTFQFYNPYLRELAVETYINLRRTFPDHAYDEKQTFLNTMLLQSGKGIVPFIQHLRSHSDLFDSLVNRILEKAKEVERVANYSEWLSALVEKKLPAHGAKPFQNSQVIYPKLDPRYVYVDSNSRGEDIIISQPWLLIENILPHDAEELASLAGDQYQLDDELLRLINLAITYRKATIRYFIYSSADGVPRGFSTRQRHPGGLQYNVNEHGERVFGLRMELVLHDDEYSKPIILFQESKGVYRIDYYDESKTKEIAIQAFLKQSTKVYDDESVKKSLRRVLLKPRREGIGDKINALQTMMPFVDELGAEIRILQLAMQLTGFNADLMKKIADLIIPSKQQMDNCLKRLVNDARITEFDKPLPELPIQSELSSMIEAIPGIQKEIQESIKTRRFVDTILRREEGFGSKIKLFMLEQHLAHYQREERIQERKIKEEQERLNAEDSLRQNREMANTIKRFEQMMNQHQALLAKENSLVVSALPVGDSTHELTGKLDAFISSPNHKTLNLSGMAFDESMAESLHDFLNVHRDIVIREIDLNHTELNAATLPFIVKALTSRAGLETVNFSGQRFRGKDILAIEKLIASSIRHLYFEIEPNDKNARILLAVLQAGNPALTVHLNQDVDELGILAQLIWSKDHQLPVRVVLKNGFYPVANSATAGMIMPVDAIWSSLTIMANHVLRAPGKLVNLATEIVNKRIYYDALETKDIVDVAVSPVAFLDAELMDSETAALIHVLGQDDQYYPSVSVANPLVPTALSLAADDSRSLVEPCIINVHISGENISCSHSAVRFFNVQQSKGNIGPNCSLTDIQSARTQFCKQLPDYDKLQWQHELDTLGHIALESSASTGLILLVHDVMLNQGYPEYAASWGSFTVAQAFNTYRILRSLYEGASYLSALLPMVLSSLTYYVLKLSGLAEERTASWWGSAVAVAASSYAGAGFFSAVSHLTASAFARKLVTMGEEAFASHYLVSGLKKKLAIFTEEYEKLLEACSSEERDDLTTKIKPRLDEMSTSPTMKHYAELDALHHRIHQLLAQIDRPAVHPKAA